jgi:hypothetical protein
MQASTTLLMPLELARWVQVLRLVEPEITAGIWLKLNEQILSFGAS